MNTDHPTTLIHFVFAFTRCSVRVYTHNLDTMRSLLIKNPGVEIYTPEEGDTFQEIETDLLADILIGSLLPVVEAIIPKPEDVFTNLKNLLEIRK